MLSVALKTWHADILGSCVPVLTFRNGRMGIVDAAWCAAPSHPFPRCHLCRISPRLPPSPPLLPPTYSICTHRTTAACLLLLSLQWRGRQAAFSTIPPRICDRLVPPGPPLSPPPPPAPTTTTLHHTPTLPAAAHLVTTAPTCLCLPATRHIAHYLPRARRILTNNLRAARPHAHTTCCTHAHAPHCTRLPHSHCLPT